MRLSIILAVDSYFWIWKNNKLPWNISSDMKYFKEITSKTKDLAKHNAVIMWRKTWESIPSKFRPLKNRINCILSKSLKVESINSKIDDFILYFNSLESCINEIKNKENLENVFVIWWAKLYNQVINSPLLERIYLTRVFWNFHCDVFFEKIPNDFEIQSVSELKEENWIRFNFQVWEKEKKK